MTGRIEDHSQLRRTKHKVRGILFSFPTTRPIVSVSPARTVHCVKITYNYSSRKEGRIGPGDFRTLKDHTSLVSGDSWDGAIAPLPRASTTDLLGIPQLWAPFSFALSEIAETEGFGFNYIFSFFHCKTQNKNISLEICQKPVFRTGIMLHL